MLLEIGQKLIAAALPAWSFLVRASVAGYRAPPNAAHPDDLGHADGLDSYPVERPQAPAVASGDRPELTGVAIETAHLPEAEVEVVGMAIWAAGEVKVFTVRREGRPGYGARSLAESLRKSQDDFDPRV